MSLFCFIPCVLPPNFFICHLAIWPYGIAPGHLPAISSTLGSFIIRPLPFHYLKTFLSIILELCFPVVWANFQFMHSSSFYFVSIIIHFNKTVSLSLYSKLCIIVALTYPWLCFPGFQLPMVSCDLKILTFSNHRQCLLLISGHWRCHDLMCRALKAGDPPSDMSLEGG